jgi:hypothetical protein
LRIDRLLKVRSNTVQRKFFPLWPDSSYVVYILSVLAIFTLSLTGGTHNYSGHKYRLSSRHSFLITNPLFVHQLDLFSQFQIPLTNDQSHHFSFTNIITLRVNSYVLLSKSTLDITHLAKRDEPSHGAYRISEINSAVACLTRRIAPKREILVMGPG